MAHGHFCCVSVLPVLMSVSVITYTLLGLIKVIKYSPFRKELYLYLIEINPPLVKYTGNISRGSCKSGKQTSAHARVCLQDLQVPREIFLYF